MKNGSQAHYLRKLIAYFVCLNLGMLTPWVGIANASSPPTLLADKITKELVNSRAAKYTQALNEIDRLATTPLKSKDDLKRVHEIIKKSKEGLGFASYRMIQIAMENPTLRKSVEDEVKKNPTEEAAIALLKRLKSNPSSVFEFNGARQAQSSIESQLKRDAEILKKVGTKLRQAAEEVKKQQGATVLPPPLRSERALSFTGGATKNHRRRVQNEAAKMMGGRLYGGVDMSFNFAGLAENSASHGGPARAVMIDPVTISILVGIAVGIIATIVVSYALVKIHDYVAEDYDTGKTPFERCLDTVDNSYIQCLAGCETDLCPDCCRIGCDAGHLLALAACALLPIGPANVVEGP